MVVLCGFKLILNLSDVWMWVIGLLVISKFEVNLNIALNKDFRYFGRKKVK